MISVISIGIEKIANDSKGQINCAKIDADKFFTTVTYILDKSVDQKTSICVSNITKVEFENIISTINGNTFEDDTIILYFSGHGDLDDDIFHLCFSDYDNEQRGRLSTNHLSDLLKLIKGRAIVILDCCHSGAALEVAHKKTLFSVSNTSIIASCEAYSLCNFDEKGSFFTNSLCQCLHDLFHETEKISLVKIVSNLKNKYKAECQINIQEGVEDIILGKRDNVIDFDPYFVHRFITKSSSSIINVKEILWYSLIEMPDICKSRILEEYYRQISYGEPSWLVRRAIGSLIESISNFAQYKEEIIVKLLDSMNWMYVCIGLIGSRSKLHQKEIVDKIRNIMLSDLPMDAIWLAHLYYSDSDFYDFEKSFESKLALTPWGILDIWIRASSKNSCSFDQFEVHVKDKILLDGLKAHLALSNVITLETVDKQYHELINSKIGQYVYNVPDRGPIKYISHKWLLSSLYGSWRNNLVVDLTRFINNLSADDAAKELSMASMLPLVEMRMSVFNSIESFPNLIDDYSKSLIWGLKDKHPWVRREALKVFKNLGFIGDLVSYEDIDRFIYPGLLDLLIELRNSNVILNGNFQKTIKTIGLTPHETEALCRLI